LPSEGADYTRPPSGGVALHYFIMDTLMPLASALGLGMLAGARLYATVLAIGLMLRFDWVSLPAAWQQASVLADTRVLIVSGVACAVEFIADKIPWVDSIWDAIHTVVRPFGGALIAVATAGDTSPAVEGLIALAGGALAATTHFSKAGTRAVVNTSPEPFSNWILSLGEDVFVVGLGVLALKYPAAAAIVVIVCLILMIAFAGWIIRAVRRRWAARRAAVIHPS
jgi:Domain of unknown function (DUF4126)